MTINVYFSSFLFSVGLERTVGADEAFLPRRGESVSDIEPKAEGAEYRGAGRETDQVTCES